MRDPTRILDAAAKALPDCVKLLYVDVEEDHKLETLVDLYEVVGVRGQHIIFANTVRKVNIIKDSLGDKFGFPLVFSHKDLPRADRQRAIAAFCAGTAHVLVTTDDDIAGRDLPPLRAMINFDLPGITQNYPIRISCDPRHNHDGDHKKVVCIDLLSQRDKEPHALIARHLDTQIDELTMDFEKFFE